MNSISAEELRTRIVSGKEFALIDVRKKGEFAKAHLLFAVSIPLEPLDGLPPVGAVEKVGTA